MILTKIQVSAIFHMRDIRRNDLPKFVWWLMDPISSIPEKGLRRYKRFIFFFLLQISDNLRDGKKLTVSSRKSK